MKYLICVFILLISVTALAESTDAFIVDINDQRIRVTSPAKKIKIASIIIRNETEEKIISEIRSVDKVLKRFVLKSLGREVIQVDFSKVEKLYYVPVSPPFEAAELKFSREAYEIPEKL